MSSLKRLAGQTAIYGVSSILGRILNYFLVPLHTYFFAPEAMGTVSILYGYVALVLIVITFGMETTFFRFVNKEDYRQNAYNVAATSVIATSLILTSVIFYYAGGIAQILPGISDTPSDIRLIKWLAAILFIDGALSIPFAKLRVDNKPLKFAIAKLTAIFANIALQLFFLFVVPAIILDGWLPFMKGIAQSISDLSFGIEYIFLANLLSNLLIFPILFKEFAEIRPSLNSSALKPMLIYALPLLLTGVAGWFTTELDKVVIASWLPTDGLEMQGVYSQTFKLAALIMLAIQAFRYAAEPFFFSQSKDPEAPELFAKTLHYFTLLSLIILVAVSVNVDLLAIIFLKNPAYRVALYLVPVIMFGKLLYGVYINLSIWFKIRDKTIFGLLFTLLGALVALVTNYLLLPRIGVLGSAISIITSFGSMSLVCYLVGRKYFKVPYDFGVLALYTLGTAVLVAASFKYQNPNFTVDSGINILITVIYIGIIYAIERKNLYQEIK